LLGFKRASPHIRPLRAVHTFDSLKVRAFRYYWISMLFQWLAFNMLTVAKGWFLYELTTSPFLLGLMGASLGIPMSSLSFLGGAIADRVDKRKLLMWGTLGQGIVMGAVALLISVGVVVWWHLLVASAVQGVLLALTIPARQSAIPQMVKGDQIMNAMSINTAGMNVCTLLGPAVAGFLVAYIDAMGVFWLIAALFGASSLVMLWLPSLSPEENGHSKNMGRDIIEGLRFVRKDAVLVLLLSLTFITVAFGTPLNNLLPVFTEDVLQVGPSGLGMLLSLMGMGALVGSLVMASMGDFRRKGLVLLVMTLVWGGSVMAFTTTSVYGLALFLMVPIGIGMSARNVIVNTLMLAHSTPEMRGRVMSLSMMMWGLQPLGLLPIGAAAEVIGASLAVRIGGAVVASVALGFLLFSRTLRRL
jgi:MFS family permease